MIGKVSCYSRIAFEYGGKKESQENTRLVMWENSIRGNFKDAQLTLDGFKTSRSCTDLSMGKASTTGTVRAHRRVVLISQKSNMVRDQISFSKEI